MKLRAIALALLLGWVTFPACGKLNFDPQNTGPGEFSPKSLSGLQLWLRADQGVTTSGVNVQSWSEVVAQTNFTPATAGWFPSFQAQNPNLNNQPSIDFTFQSFNRYLQALSVPAGYLCGGQYTTVLIGRPNFSVKAGQTIEIFNWLSAGVPYFKDKLTYSATNPVGHGRSIQSTWAGGLITYGHVSATVRIPATASIWGFKLSQTADRTFDNGVLGNTVVSTVTYGGACDPLDVQVGLGMTNTPGTGTASLELAEVIVYGRDLSAEELGQLGCYARTRYAIPNYSGTCN